MYTMGFHLISYEKKLPTFEDLDTIAELVLGKVRFKRGVTYISNIDITHYKDKTIREAVNNFLSPVGLDLYIFFTKHNIESDTDGISLMNQCITNAIPYLKVRKPHGEDCYEIYNWQLADTKRRVREKLVKKEVNLPPSDIED